MKKIGIVGAGISGLSLGKMLKENFDIEILEKETTVGGIARTSHVGDITYHKVGGHCFNSHNQKIMDFIFNKILAITKWHKVIRDAKINLNGNFISYPIEFSIKEIAKFDKRLAYNITKDFLGSSNNKDVSNLADWFVTNFGKTLADIYFIPYNNKIWQMNPKKMSYLWVKGKLPIPNKEEFFESLIEEKKDQMPHNTFYYPNSNDQNNLIEALASDLNIKKCFEVVSIAKNGDKWIINDALEYDFVVSTMPLNLLPKIIKKVPFEIIEEARKLKYNRITNVLWETKPIKFTWSYFPSLDTIFHRHIHIGNFFNPKKNYTITESMGVHSFEEMVLYGKKFDYLLKPLDYHVSDHAYVVYDHNYKFATTKINNYLHEIGLYSIGRFGEWKYYNMDACMESAMKLAIKMEKIEKDKNI